MPPVKQHPRHQDLGVSASSGLRFVVQKHQGRSLHYDFRLEVDGVLKSWALPKGPSLDPAIKRLAVAVDDHPLEYANFEGVLPKGEYGAGPVMVWDCGTYTPEDSNDVADCLANGELKFALYGQKLRGSWVLIRTRNGSWLLIKHRDAYASEKDITKLAPRSVLSGRLISEIAAEQGDDMRQLSARRATE
jgi:bifunctional non-homologous end joining protein LigD